MNSLFNCVCSPGDYDAEELEEGEWIPEEDFDPKEENFDEGFFSLMFLSFAFTLIHIGFLGYGY